MSQGIKSGKNLTRKDWEKNHKPTCNVYPCDYWREIHCHFQYRDIKKQWQNQS